MFSFRKRTERNIRNDQDRRSLVVGNFIKHTLILHLGWIILLAVLQLWIPFWLTIAGAVVYLISYYSWSKEYLNTASLLLILNLQAMLVLGSGMVGGQGEPEIMLIAAIGLPFILFDLRTHRLVAVVLSLSNLLLYVGCGWVDIQVVFWSPSELESIVPIIYLSGVMTTMLLVFAQLFYLTTISNRYMQSLELLSERLAEESKAKDQFLAHVSHELRTPLNAINGMSHHLIEENPAGSNPKLEAIQDSGQHMLLLVNDLLDFSKLKQGVFQQKVASVHVADFVRQLNQQYHPLAQDKGVQFSIENTLDYASVSWDRKHVLQIANNLISNALKFTDKGWVRVEIFKVSYPDSNGTCIRVSNSGCGVPDHIKHEIFQAFEQGGRERSIVYGGTGLGLPIARQIAEGMGGTLELIDPSPGNTVFECKFPCDCQKTASKEQTTSLHANRTQFSGAHVLVADDNPMNIMVIREFLKTRGIAVTEVDNGVRVLDEVQKRSFDLILMDLRMPDMDGFEASRALRKLQVDTPIVALSASDYRSLADEIRAAGINGFESKPFDPVSMNVTLRQFLSSFESFEEGTSLSA